MVGSSFAASDSAIRSYRYRFVCGALKEEQSTLPVLGIFTLSHFEAAKEVYGAQDLHQGECVFKAVLLKFLQTPLEFFQRLGSHTSYLLTFIMAVN